MGAVRVEHSELIAADPQACFDAITDFDTYPQWQSAVRECRVLSRDGQKGTLVETVIDAKVRKVRYVLRYHAEPPHRLWWDYVEGDVKSIAGGYDAPRAHREAEAFRERLESVGAGQVVAVDAAAYFSRPGPRLIDGMELLAAILHPERFGAPEVEAATGARELV